LKTLDLLQVTRQGEEIRIEARARSFLHHQVRNMVGSLRMVGEGKRDAGWLGEVLAGRDRRRAGPTAPPEGLYLTAVDYP
jgi:tRNA pseudouridine38-40 synthase